MKGCAVALTLALAGCSGDAVEQNQSRSAPAETPPPSAEMAPAGNEAPPPAGRDAPEMGQSADAAVQVVRTYYALIGEGNYHAAHNLWEGRGEASGMSAESFAASFDRYARYHAEIGAPGRIDAGAGQRYIEIPVTITGLLKDGDRPFRMEGALILHRNANIPGTTQLDRRWRIRDSSIRPRPATGTPPEPSEPRVTALYRCEDRTRYTARFDNEAGTMELVAGRERFAILDQKISGSGIRYEGGGYSLRCKGSEAVLTFPDGRQKRCDSDPD